MLVGFVDRWAAPRALRVCPSGILSTGMFCATGSSLGVQWGLVISRALGVDWGSEPLSHSGPVCHFETKSSRIRRPAAADSSSASVAAHGAAVPLKGQALSPSVSQASLLGSPEPAVSDHAMQPRWGIRNVEVGGSVGKADLVQSGAHEETPRFSRGPPSPTGAPCASAGQRPFGSGPLPCCTLQPPSASPGSSHHCMTVHSLLVTAECWQAVDTARALLGDRLVSGRCGPRPRSPAHSDPSHPPSATKDFTSTCPEAPGSILLQDKAQPSAASRQPDSPPPSPGATPAAPSSWPVLASPQAGPPPCPVRRWALSLGLDWS